MVRRALVIGLCSFAAACGGPQEVPESPEANRVETPSGDGAAPSDGVGSMNVPGCNNTDWDSGVTVVLNPHNVPAYANQAGWTGAAAHVTSKIECELTPWGSDNDDLWIYWDNAYVANPANKNNIRLRYQGTNTACRNRIASGGAGVYFNDGAPGSADNVFIGGRKPYLRVVLGYACIYEAHNIVMVWP